MKAITTRYLGATNYKGSRIKATTGDGLGERGLVMSYDHEYEQVDNHRRCAEALAKQLNWNVILIGGESKGCYVFTIVDQMKLIKPSVVSYSARGYVYGNYWGGGRGTYPSQRYLDRSIKNIITDINNDFKSGGLDGGMGYESLIYAKMEIKTKWMVKINGEEYYRETFCYKELGSLDDLDPDDYIMLDNIDLDFGL